MKFRALGLAVVSLLFVFSVCRPASAQVSVVTSLGSLSSNDQVDWSQFGDGYVSFPPISFTSNGSLPGVISETGDSPVLSVLQQGVDWTGNFPNNDTVMWTGLGSNVMQISLNSPVKGIGTYIDSDFYGPDIYTAQIQAFDSSNTLLGTFMASGPADSPALFLGVTSTTPDISSITYTTTAGPNAGDFAVDSLFLTTSSVTPPPPPAVPEPGTLALLIGVGLPGLGLIFPRRRLVKSYFTILCAVAVGMMALCPAVVQAVAVQAPITLNIHSPLVIGGHPVSATVTINSPAPSGGTTISLSSDKQEIANGPSSLVIPAGQTSSTPFTITTYLVNLMVLVHITANDNAGHTATALLRVFPGPRIGGGGGYGGLQAYSPWPDVGANGFHNGRSVGSGAIGVEKWRVYTHGSDFSQAAIARDGTIYAGTDGGLYALNPDGTIKWVENNGYRWSSSPAIGTDGTIYASSGNHLLYAIYPNGAVKWTFDPVADGNDGDGSETPVIGADGTIYIGGGAYDHYLFAINPDGSQKWVFGPSPNMDAGGMSTPAIGADGTIYDTNTWDFFAVTPAGVLKWFIKPSPGGAYFSSPSIGNDGTIYVDSSLGPNSGANTLYAYNPDGSQKWNFLTNVSPYGANNVSPAIGADGTVYEAVDGGYLYAINPADGSQEWDIQLSSSQNVASPPIIGGDGTIYVYTENGYVNAVSPYGILNWTYYVGTLSGNSANTSIGADGTIYVGGTGSVPGFEGLFAIK